MMVLSQREGNSHLIALSFPSLCSQLPNSGLSGNIPRIVGQLSELQVLDLSSNNLVGVIPNELGNLTQLQVG